MILMPWSKLGIINHYEGVIIQWLIGIYSNHFKDPYYGWDDHGHYRDFWPWHNMAESGLTHNALKDLTREFDSEPLPAPSRPDVCMMPVEAVAASEADSTAANPRQQLLLVEPWFWNRK